LLVGRGLYGERLGGMPRFSLGSRVSVGRNLKKSKGENGVVHMQKCVEWGVTR